MPSIIMFHSHLLTWTRVQHKERELPSSSCCHQLVHQQVTPRLLVAGENREQEGVCQYNSVCARRQVVAMQQLLQCLTAA
jgi:hypothetical protein